VKVKVGVAAILLLVSAVGALAEEIIHYKNRPVTIQLVEGEERSIEFGSHVQVGLTRGQQEGALFRVQSAQGFLHIKPNETFPEQRIQVRRVSDGRVILLDLISEKRTPDAIAALEPVKILLEKDNVVEGQTYEEAVSGEAGEGIADAPVITPVELVRYASQRLYGPPRLHRDIPGITDTPLGVNAFIKLFQGENKYKTSVKPIVAYRGGPYYLCALYIKNISNAAIKLDYLDINLPFSTATFQHHTLQRNGIPGDSTVLYLVSEEPLKSTLHPWTYYHDRLEEMAQAEKK